MTCTKCNKQVKHYALGLCKSCYSKIWNNSNKEKVRNCCKLYRDKNMQTLRNKKIAYNLKKPCMTTWIDMKRRCYDINYHAYPYYGARGIRICEDWLVYKVFEQWCLSSGWQKGMHVDRIDSDGGYYPDNCQILTKCEHSCKTNRERANGCSSCEECGCITKYYAKSLCKKCYERLHPRKRNI